MNIYEKYIGKLFDDRYRIDRVIGVGGMAVVFEAYDLRDARVVAVKLLREEISNDVQSVKRFINESKAVAMMDHPNIVHIFDVMVSDKLKYIVMERIEGITLKKYMNAKKQLSFHMTVSVTEQILEALAHAHAHGIIHRDIKPQNVMLLRSGKVIVTDFGIAKLPDAENVTMADKAIGTVYYISPEQASGKPIDARSDLYSLGAMMYEMITGKLPFTADSPVSVALKQVNENPVPPRDILPSIPRGLEDIILCAMQKRPEKRFQSAAEMLGYVKKIKDDPFVVLRIPGQKSAGKQDGDSGRKRKKIRIPFLKPSRYHEDKRTYLPVILGVCFSFLLVALISGYYVIDQMFLGSEFNFFKSVVTEEITVEQFLNTEYSDMVEADLKEKGYTLDVSYEYSDVYAENVIFEQTPEAGSVRKLNNFTLKLTVSRGKQYTTMENYTMNEYRETKIKLLREGYQVEVEKVPSDVFKAGMIVSTVPAGGENVEVGQTIKLIVSAGSNVSTFPMPKFVGKTSSEAASLLSSSGLRKGEIKYENSNAYPADTVMRQEIAPDTPVSTGTAVDLTVSLGPAN